ncbi:sensor histidine kinase [Micromonospora sp. CPCC 205371]|nr:sensor histidine kinase [Micromonospora sp. CPCC 205371]
MPPLDPRRTRLVLADTLAGALITAAYVGFTHFDGSDGSPVFTGPAWLGWVVAAAVGLPVAVRRVWPRAVLAMVVTASTAATLLDLTREPYTATALALYAVGLLEPARRSAQAVAAALLMSASGLYVGEAVVTPAGTAVDALLLIGLVALVTGGGWAAGTGMRYRRANAEQAAQREKERDKRQIQAEERLRIAREMHDIVSHHLSLIAVQAGIANHVAEQHPAEAREALRVIETASRGALTEMRGMLGVLRFDPVEPAASRNPVPGLAGLPDLAERATTAGVAVDLDVTTAGTLPAGVQLAAYRIVQEGLTNAVKHAAPARCTVRVVADERVVTVQVTDDGERSGASKSGGHGLIGMRERVAMFGGELTAGPGPAGGFAVSARLPYQGQEQA